MTLLRKPFFVFWGTILLIVGPPLALLLYINAENRQNFARQCDYADGQVYAFSGYDLCLDKEGHVLKVPR